jgi:hypothetical protein
MGSMKDLLGDEPYAPRTPSQITRSQDPDTSKQAAAAIVPKIESLQKEVLGRFRERLEMTDVELEQSFGDKCPSCGASTARRYSSCRTRRAELTECLECFPPDGHPVGKLCWCKVPKLGYLRNTGKKKLQAGRNRIVWGLR